MSPTAASTAATSGLHPPCAQLGFPKTCTAQLSDMSCIRAMFGLATGGQYALTALAALAGGDYLVGGLKNVGEKLALAIITQLLQGCSVRSLALPRGPLHLCELGSCQQNPQSVSATSSLVVYITCRHALHIWGPCRS